MNKPSHFPHVLIPILGVPAGEERNNAWHLSGNLQGLKRYCQTLESAVRLADYCESHSGRLSGPLKEAERMAAESLSPSTIKRMKEFTTQQDLYNSWLSIAARDAAMTIYNFGHLFEVIQGSIKNCPTVFALIDRTAMKKAGELFREKFPNFRYIRHAVGHESERTQSKSKTEEHAFSGVYSSGNLNIDGAQNISLTIMSNRQLIMTWKKQIVSIEVSWETARTLDEVKTLTFAAFRPVSEGLYGIDVGDLVAPTATGSK